MIVKTKKYQLDSKTFVSLGYKNVMREFWWAFLVPPAIMLIAIAVPSAVWWCLGIALTLLVLYLVFWWVVLSGLPQLEQNKVLFDKLMYEINSQQVLIKLNERQGMPLTWDKIVKAQKNNDAFMLFLSKVQFIHLPFKIFKSEHEVRFVESILVRKNLLPQTSKPESAPSSTDSKVAKSK